MNIRFKFYLKSRSQNKAEAISLAENLEYYEENDFYIVKFESIYDEDLLKFCRLLASVKGSEVLIDDQEPIEALDFYKKVKCENKTICKGICKNVRLGNRAIDKFTLLNPITDGIMYTENGYLIDSIIDYLDETDDPNRFKLNKEMLLGDVKQKTELEGRLCDKFDLARLESEIKTLPDEIIYEEKDTEFPLDKILTSCELDDKMIAEDMIKCSKIISLNHSYVGLLKVKGENVLIQNFPDISTVLLVKYNLQEENLEEEREKPIIQKKGDWFAVKNSYMQLYFQLFDENPNVIEDKMKELRKL